MNAALFAYSRQGCKTARRVMECLEETDALEAYTMERFEEAGFSPLRKPGREFYGSIFNRVHAMIFISSVGIAVREIAPHLKSKATDPAVLVLDELGRFCDPGFIRSYWRCKCPGGKACPEVGSHAGDHYCYGYQWTIFCGCLGGKKRILSIRFVGSKSSVRCYSGGKCTAEV